MRVSRRHALGNETLTRGEEVTHPRRHDAFGTFNELRGMRDALNRAPLGALTSSKEGIAVDAPG
jgi:hypothetical protein